MNVKTARTVITLLAICLVSPWALAQEQFLEGIHYERIDVPVKTGLEDAKPPQVEVVEVFSYMCIHCFSFDPVLEQWKADGKPANAAFNRLPAVFSSDWSLMAKAFYAAEILGVGAQMHGPLFEAVHVKPRNLRDESKMAQLFEEFAGVAEEEFTKAYNSFFVRSRVMQARAKSQAYGITGVPVLIVNGKYRVNGKMAGSNEAMLDVVNYLVEKESANR